MHHGVFTKAPLLGDGATTSRIRTWVRNGTLTRLRPGWFATAAADLKIVEAVRSGGCSCVSALRHHGVWVPESSGALHIRVADHRSGKQTSCRPVGENPGVFAAIDDVETALRCAVRCLDSEGVVIVLDSILHLRLADIDALHHWLRDAPVAIRRLIGKTAEAEAGTETMAWLRLRAKGIRVRTQVQVTPEHRVDLLVGERLIIECDSRAWHGDWQSHERDDARDRQLTALGFIVVRLSYRHIHDNWPEIEQHLLGMIRQKRHMWPRQRTEKGLSRTRRG